MPHILLVENEALIRDKPSRNRKRTGYRIISAVDGQSAENMAAARPYNLMLTNMSLPVMDGWEATRQIRASGRKVPIIALTAHAMEGDERTVREADCDDYDTKPVEFPRLLGRMERLLDI